MRNLLLLCVGGVRVELLPVRRLLGLCDGRLSVCLSVADDGGVFKSRTRRTESRDAVEIRDSRDTATDLPLDYIRAQQVDVSCYHQLSAVS